MGVFLVGLPSLHTTGAPIDVEAEELAARRMVDLEVLRLSMAPGCEPAAACDPAGGSPPAR